MEAAERETWSGRPPERPFVLLVQPTRFDPSRAPSGGHIAWAYCHVPGGATVDMLPRIEQQIAASSRALPLYRETIGTEELVAGMRTRRDHPLHTLLRRMYHEVRN